MLNSYTAILRDGHLEWTGPVPEELKGPEALKVQVTVLPSRGSGARAAALMEEMASSCPPVQIGDPVEWQRETRRDRSLPGRES